MPKILRSNELKDYLFLIIGSLIIALSVVLFFLPNNFTTGGTPGMAILLHHLTGLSISTLVIVINAPLLIWGAKYIGKRFAVKTIVTILFMSLFIKFFGQIFIDLAITQNILLASLFGGVFMGIGVGLIIKGNSSAGGSTIIAIVAKKTSNIKPANVILILIKIADTIPNRTASKTVLFLIN